MSDQLPIGLSNGPYYIREHKDFAVTQERYRHSQAMYSLGEMAMFVLMWKVEDFTAGYVRRCPRCFDGNNEALSRAAEAYRQPTQNKCPMCYGTTFEGGVRAKVIRPALFTDTDDQEQQDQRGAKYPQNVTIETTSDFRYRAGDFVFRSDGSRWQLGSPTRVTLRTGFTHPSQTDDSIGYSPTSASLEDKTGVAWMIPPNEDELKTMLNQSHRYPVADMDMVNGDLIPRGYTD